MGFNSGFKGLNNPIRNLQRLWLHHNATWTLPSSRYLVAFMRLKVSRRNVQQRFDMVLNSALA